MRGCVIRRAPLRSAWGRCAFGLRPHPRLTGLKLNRIFTLDVLLEKEPKKELGAKSYFFQTNLDGFVFTYSINGSWDKIKQIPDDALPKYSSFIAVLVISLCSFK